MHSASEAPAGIAFGRFLLLPHRRELLADGRPVKLGGRAFDVLMALIEARGAVVSKNALMARVWPERIVEENNLQWQISVLRAAFGADRNLIRTVSGRGYQLTAEIDTVYANPEADAGTAIAAAHPDPSEARCDGGIPGELPPTNLPEPVSELVGRDEVLGEILSLAAEHRLVTLTGAGGIGKTRLALAAAHRLLPQFAGGVWLAEFSPIADPGLVPVTVAAAIGLDLGGGGVTAQRVAQAIAGRRLVLVLDTCEHVIGAAAALAEAVLRAGGTLRLLATSREPLRAEGEWVYPVPSLAVPAEDAEDADDLLRYGGVRLFIERLRAAEPHFAPDRRSAAMIAAICRRLDGIPLAIELAAARATSLGVEEVTTHLDDRFRILTGGRRTALPRHQTLRAALDWSYELLSEPERVILRRLSVFAGAFMTEAAGVIASGASITRAEAVEGLLSLIAKSLVSMDAGFTGHWRLLDTTRAYALEKLEESGEREPVAQRHAEYYRDLFERAENQWEKLAPEELVAHYSWHVDNLRAALDWAFSQSGDALAGTALVIAAVPFLMQLSLLEECRMRVEQALAVAGAGTNDPSREMKLQVALARSLMYTRDTVIPELGAGWSKAEAALTRALELAESLDDVEYELRALRGLWAFHRTARRPRVALALAERINSLAIGRSDPNDRLIGQRLIGVSLHFLGDQQSARDRLEATIADFVMPSDRSGRIRFQLDGQVQAYLCLARILWLQGFPDQAMRTAERSIKEARAINHANSLCSALARAACPIAMLVGDLTAAEEYTTMLINHARRHALALWRAYGCTYQGLLASEREDAVGGLQLLRTGLGGPGRSKAAVLRLITLLMSKALEDGEIVAGLDALEEEIESCETTEEYWMISELLRVKGELLLMQAASSDVTAAEDCFRRALDWARRQGALSWELRAAMSLARLRRNQVGWAEAAAVLRAVYDRFTEGFETADLKAAKALLAAGGQVHSETAMRPARQSVTAGSDLARAIVLFSLLSR
jgi:predicted ATPase/DNA-binding winged helix-turn-helix (wHTH) protein